MTWAETELGKSSTHSYAWTLLSLQELIWPGNEKIVFATVVQIRSNCTGISVSERCKSSEKAIKWLTVHCKDNLPPPFFEGRAVVPLPWSMFRGTSYKATVLPSRAGQIRHSFGRCNTKIAIDERVVKLINALMSFEVLIKISKELPCNWHLGQFCQW